MKVLLIGSGAREHAIAWKISQSNPYCDIYAAPGNAGISQIAENISVKADDIDTIVEIAKDLQIDLTVVGPEVPLANGIADRFNESGLLIFGPSMAASRIEGSKIFAKGLMNRHGIPTAKSKVFDDHSLALQYLAQCEMPVVIKADGLAAGKGVTVAESIEECASAINSQMVLKEFGSAGNRVLIEEHLEGTEVSVFAFVDGSYVSPMVAACDYKRLREGDVGPNTGGMGSYSPPPKNVWNDSLDQQVRVQIMEPIAKAMAVEGFPYQGVLYAGLMITPDGPKVIEFNCRLGDPEAQVILPRLKTDLLQVMMSVARGTLAEVAVEWDPISCVGVVIASSGYPAKYDIGYLINGLDDVNSNVFHGGTKFAEGVPDHHIVSDGGRVLTVSAVGNTFEEARSNVYADVEHISFTGSFYRSDIGLNC